MTTSTSSISASTAEAGGPQRLGRLGGAVVGVPEPAATAAFLEQALGFVVREEGDRWIATCEGDYGARGQDAIALLPAAALELVEVRFEVADDYDLDALAARVRAAGGAPAERDGGGLCFADAAGNPLAVVRSSAQADPRPGHDPLRPRRLGHLNLKAPDTATTAAWYQDVLGMRLSEQIGESLFFLRIAAEHHNLGLRGGDRATLHHLAFEVGGWNVYQPMLDRMAELGHTVEYGPGRHRPGNNIFTYLRDPSSGLRLELYAEMAIIADDTTYTVRRWEAGDRMTRTINRWGPTPPQSFLD